MDTILVTGGAGFTGGNFIPWLLARRDLRIVNLDCLTYAGNLAALSSWIDSPRHVFVHGNIADQNLVRSLLRDYQCQAIVNLAAETHVDRSIGDPASFVQTNVVGTFELLESALAYWESLSGELRERFRFLHVSTDEVYGSLPADGYFTETTRFAPNSPYSASKAASDHFVRVYYQTYGMPVLTTNSSNHYGPCQYPEKLVPLTILNVLAGKPVPVYGQGDNVRDWLHIDDLCRALHLVLQRGQCGEVYNVGGGCQRTNLQVVITICETIDRMRPSLPYGPSSKLVKFVSDRPGHDFRYAVDATKIRRELGWQATIEFEVGIERTVQWYLQNPNFVRSAGTRTWTGRRDPRRPAVPGGGELQIAIE